MPSRVGWSVKAWFPKCRSSSRTIGGAKSTAAASAAVSSMAPSYRVRRPEIGLTAPPLALQIAKAWPRRALDALWTDEPAQGSSVGADRLLQQYQPLEQCVRSRRTAGHVDVHRQEAVDALDHAVDVVHSAGIGAGPHRDDPARLEHLVIEPLHHGRHLREHRAGDDDEIRLPRTRAKDLCAEARYVVFAGECRRHLDIAAGQAEVERPDRVFPAPGNDVLEFAEDQVATDSIRKAAAAGPRRSRRRRSALGLRFDERPSHGHYPCRRCGGRLRSEE